MIMRIAAIGECMLELSSQGTDLWRQGFAGDTNNTATYLARLLGIHGGQVDYVTALGDDPFSDAMLERWQAEGLGTDHVQRLAGLLPGVYAIRTQSHGERQFFYWRNQSAARQLMDQPEKVAGAIEGADLVYLSGITLAILEPAARTQLMALLANAKRVAFDPNFRPRLWPDPVNARATMEQMLTCTHIALPTFDDEVLLFGDTSPAQTIQRHQAAKVEEIVVKRGDQPALVCDGQQVIEVSAQAMVEAIDTTGAGDSFNAGYLAARLLGHEPVPAVAIGHKLAATVVQHRGAIIPSDAMPELGLVT